MFKENSNESRKLPDIPEISRHLTLEELYTCILAIPDHLLTQQASGDMAQAVASPVVRKLFISGKKSLGRLLTKLGPFSHL